MMTNAESEAGTTLLMDNMKLDAVAGDSVVYFDYMGEDVELTTLLEVVEYVNAYNENSNVGG